MTDPAEAHQPIGADYVSDRAFADFPIREETLRGIHDKLGFKVATPVQAETVDAAVAGRDMVVRAKTGTGKTAAFCIPIVERIPDGHRKPLAIVLEPTRELAQQTAEQAVAIATYRDLTVVTLVGGVAMGPQETALAQGASLIVGTPGRVLDHIRRGNLDPSGITIACLDEADEMLSMGFFEDVTAILDRTAAERQVLLFSATISPDTQRIVRRYLRDPLDVMLSTDADGVELLTHSLYETSPAMHKARALLYVLDVEDPDSAIIFCNTREDTATVATYLDRQGLDVQMLSGELSQSRRNAVMRRVKSGAVRFLVATDVAARGIDISDLSHVVNYSLPQDPDVYLHRTGRTGRIGKKGVAISLVGGTDLSTRKVLETQKGIHFEVRTMPDADEAVQKRVDRQARQIKEAMGSLVFESYLPTVRALLDRPDGHMLLAAALRAFFQWDRERRAEADDAPTVADALAEVRDDAGRGASKGGRRSRDDRGERPDRTERRGPRDTPRAAEPATPDQGPADAERKKRRRKKKTRGPDDATAAAPLDDLDALLDVGDTADSAPAAAPRPPKPAPARPALDDLDAFLDVED